jgi:[amino group carrier protein]-L-2-aminoadipate 6-kinase
VSEDRQVERDGNVLVVKLGGSTIAELTPAWWDDLARLGMRTFLILVHGWSRALARLDPAHGLPDAFARDRYGNRSRITTPPVLSDIHSVSTAITAEVRAALETRGLPFQRILGCDGLLNTGHGERWWWRDRQLVEFDNLVGPLTGVEVAKLRALRETAIRGVVITPLARDPADRIVNVDADRAAAGLAVALNAPVLVLITDVPKLLVDGSPVDRLNFSSLVEFRERAVTGGMRKKIRAAGEALEGGVEKVLVGNGLVSDMLTDRAGTTIDGGIVRPDALGDQIS